jgi:hypothetical protein
MIIYLPSSNFTIHRAIDLKSKPIKPASGAIPFSIRGVCSGFSSGLQKSVLDAPINSNPALLASSPVSSAVLN